MQSPIDLTPIDLTPIDLTPIDSTMLTAQEVYFIDDYHSQVRAALSVRLYGDAHAFLVEQTQPLGERDHMSA